MHLYTASKVKHRHNIFVEKVKLSIHEFILVTLMKNNYIEDSGSATIK